MSPQGAFLPCSNHRKHKAFTLTDPAKRSDAPICSTQKQTRDTLPATVSYPLQTACKLTARRLVEGENSHKQVLTDTRAVCLQAASSLKFITPATTKQPPAGTFLHSQPQYFNEPHLAGSHRHTHSRGNSLRAIIFNHTDTVYGTHAHTYHESVILKFLSSKASKASMPHTPIQQLNV